MANVQTNGVAASNTANKSGKRGRKPKGEEAFVINFVDDKDVGDYAKPPVNVKRMIIKEKSGASEYVRLDGLEALLVPLAYENVARRIALVARANSSDGKDIGAIACAKAVLEQLKAGKLHARGERMGDGKAGRQFDFDLYVDTMRLTAENKHKSDKTKHKAPTDALMASYRDKLSAMTPAERKIRIEKSYKTDPIWLASFFEVQKQRAKGKTKNNNNASTNATSDLF